MSGLEIYKLLPKTNCKNAVSNLFAFAMKLAAKQVELDPAMSRREAKRRCQRGSPAHPPGQVGHRRARIQVGNETVMFRHEKTFFNKPELGAAHLHRRRRVGHIKVEAVNAYSVERVGIHMTFTAAIERLAMRDFAGAAKAVRARPTCPLC
jgi:acetyl-CoA decarbonylase/synthase complex subunit gamma